MISIDGDSRRPARVTVLGYADALDALLLVGWAGAPGAAALPAQFAGQAVLRAGTNALLANLELLDGVRDVHVVQDELRATRPHPTAYLCPCGLRRACSRQWRNLHGGTGTSDGLCGHTST
jgi:hypothetical protein